MRTLSIVGTAAMFMVGGSIIGHGFPALHHINENISAYLQNLPAISSVLAVISPILIDAIIGVIVGAICVTVFEVVKKLLPKKG